MPEAPLIEFRGVRKRFGRKQVLDGVDLAVSPREIVALMGSSGVGKTVLLRMLVGLLRPDEGDVRFAGTSIPSLDERALRPIRRRIGYVFQASALFDWMSVGENVAFALRVAEDEREALGEAQIAERVAECLELVGLPRTERLRTDELSGGMRKRVAIARALATRPEALLYDEPATGLDPGNVQRLAQVIRDLQARLRVTGLVVTHNRELAFAIADRIALLEGGRVVWNGPVPASEARVPDELRTFLAGEAEALP